MCTSVIVKTTTKPSAVRRAWNIEIVVNKVASCKQLAGLVRGERGRPCLRLGPAPRCRSHRRRRFLCLNNIKLDQFLVKDLYSVSFKIMLIKNKAPYAALPIWIMTYCETGATHKSLFMFFFFGVPTHM